MAVKDGITRCTVSLNEETLEKVDNLAKLQGTNRNAVLNTLISASIDSYLQMWELISNPNGLNTMAGLMKLANAIGDNSTANEINDFTEEIKNMSHEKMKKNKQIADVLSNKKTKKK